MKFWRPQKQHGKEASPFAPLISVKEKRGEKRKRGEEKGEERGRKEKEKVPGVG